MRQHASVESRFEIPVWLSQYEGFRKEKLYMSLHANHAYGFKRALERNEAQQSLASGNKRSELMTDTRAAQPAYASQRTWQHPPWGWKNWR
jgi:hypothetical protein